MRWTLALLVGLHGLVHLIGPVQAFGLGRVPGLVTPLSRTWGLVWLGAAVLLLVTSIAIVTWPRGWWWVGVPALVLSQAAIVSAWTDARAGTALNAVLLGGLACACLLEGPYGLRAEWRRRSVSADAPGVAVRGPPLGEAALGDLPPPVRAYVRSSGALGAPVPRAYRVRMRGRIRGTAAEPWMEFTAIQRSTLQPHTRVFLMEARKSGLPVDALHVFEDGRASMRVRLLGAFSLVAADGPELDVSETVTVLNDLCIFAPAALLDPSLVWEGWDDRSARVRFTHAGRTVHATLRFGEDGALSDFESDDRGRLAPDGRGVLHQRWTTPLGPPRRFGTLRLASHGAARWEAPEGGFAYLELEVLDVVWE